jgi:hypothetical protein
MHIVADNVDFSEFGQRQLRAQQLLRRQSRFGDV